MLGFLSPLQDFNSIDQMGSGGQQNVRVLVIALNSLQLPVQLASHRAHNLPCVGVTMLLPDRHTAVHHPQ